MSVLAERTVSVEASVLGRLAAVSSVLRDLTTGVEPGVFTGTDAVAITAAFTDVERLAAAGRTRFAVRVDESNVWRDTGVRSAAEFLARQAGTTVADAEATLSLARRLEECPATDDAFRDGLLSVRQATVVTGAAVVAPDMEQSLLEQAGSGTVADLKDVCRRVRTAGVDQAAHFAQIHRDRSFTTWTDDDGAACGRFRTTPDVGAKLKAFLQPEIEKVFTAARREGRHEPLAAYAMDALERRICRDASDEPARRGRRGGTKKAVRSAVRHVVNIVVDETALRHGFTAGDEVCEIAGIGPVPVAKVKEWLADAYFRVLVTDGIDITAVTRQTRYVDPAQRAALRVKHPKCVIVGCDTRDRVQLDHLTPFAAGGPTSTTNLNPKCAFHHYLETKGWIEVTKPDGIHLIPPQRPPPDP